MPQGDAAHVDAVESSLDQTMGYVNASRPAIHLVRDTHLLLNPCTMGRLYFDINVEL